MCRCDPDTFDLAALCALASETRDEGELKDSDHLVAMCRNHLQLVGIGIDCLESLDILPDRRRAGILSLLPENVVGQKGNDGRKIGCLGTAERDVRH
jgi:hypothetical protein